MIAVDRAAPQPTHIASALRPSDEDLTAFVRERMAHFKAPKAWHPVEALPKTATGKIQKFVLRGGAPAIARQ
jgi:fatty-acyl-CoA synthase